MKGTVLMGLFGFGSKSKRIKELEELCDVKDSFFMELMADGLRHGSSLAGKHMAERKKYKNGK